MSTGATGTLNAFVDPSSTKRTSILINGDDCYSTVNVTNDTPLYQSSVVVAPTDFNTVTIKCGTGGKKQRTPEEEIIYKNNKINTLLNQKKNLGGKSVIPIGQIKPQGRTLIKLDYEEPKPTTSTETTSTTSTNPDVFSHEEELVKILRNPVEAVRRNLVPHICGKEKSPTVTAPTTTTTTSTVKIEKNSLIGKLLEDPMLHHLADGLESDTVAKLIENSLKRLKANRSALDTSGTKDNDDMEKLINTSLAKIKEERLRLESIAANNHPKILKNKRFNRIEKVLVPELSCSSELTTAGDEDTNSMKNKFYQMLVDATLAEIEISASNDNDYEHQYESIRINGDPIYEEISEIPPPLPLSPPPLLDLDLEKKNAKSIFEGASKYDILSYLVDAKERGIVRETLQEEESDTLTDLNSNEEHPNKPIDIERNDSGVGSETSKSSRSKFQPTGNANQQQPEDDPSNGRNIQIHLCEDCDDPVDTQITESGVMFAPLVCRKCGKKRAERKEIITEIVETEEKYGRDLLIILEEFYRPMLVAGLLTQEQLSAIFLNTEELLENNQALAERMRDALDIALEQGDDDLLTAAASLLLANMEKEKELLRIFLKVSQMENTVLRRMNLNSFLMVPVQRVTKYPLLLARLYKVTPSHLDGRDLLKQSQDKIELHLTHINQEAKDVPTKLWRRISSSSPNRRASCEIDMINIKLRKMAIDTLEWNHDEVRFVLEGKLLLTQPTDGNWKKGRTIKLAPVNALLVTNGKPSANYKADKPLSDQQLSFPKHTGIREASLLLVKEKCGRYTLLREPLYLDKCVVCTEADWDDYFEVHEISSKDTFIFKAEDNIRTKQWYKQLQHHSQGMGAWRKRRNALANIMINGMLSRT
uniref:DH domain-containing protein n=1 Tax=Megaselia scalaris TaxID=36166 RepID=T1GWZ7_MEGSC